MVKSIARLKLFLSCTSELETERTLLQELITEVNQTLEELRGVTIRLIDWRRDLMPGVGTDPQQVIHAQTQDYDIYLGLLGARFGTPTPRAGSGTEDEFKAAYARFRGDPTSLRLLFYFRTGFAGNVLVADVAQLQRVQAFRTRLGSEKGVLFCDFSTSEEFIKLARHHLIQLVAKEWDTDCWKPIPGLDPAVDIGTSPFVSPTPTMRAAEDEEATILDLRVEMDEALASAMAAIVEIGNVASAGAQAQLDWKEAAEKHAASRRSPKEAQDLVNAMALNLANEARQLRPLVATFRSAADAFFDTLEQIIGLQIAQGVSSVEEMRAGILSISQADNAVRAARDTWLGIAATLASLPDATRDFKRQKRALNLQIGQLNAVIASWLDHSAGLRERFGA